MSAIFGEILTFGQANGPDVSCRVFGDEHYARYEDLDGYTAVYDEELGLFCYARLAAGAFRSTGVPLRPATAGRPGAPPAGAGGDREAKAKARRRDARRGAGRPATRAWCARSARTRGCSRGACCRPAR